MDNWKKGLDDSRIRLISKHLGCISELMKNSCKTDDEIALMVDRMLRKIGDKKEEDS